MKSQEQRIEDAAAVLKRRLGADTVAADVAREVLEAADRDPPKWPTDESIRTLWPGWIVGAVEAQRIREAFLADPIIKAAIAYRDEGHISAARRLVRAVNEAGL